MHSATNTLRRCSAVSRIYQPRKSNVLAAPNPTLQPAKHSWFAMPFFAYFGARVDDNLRIQRRVHR